MDEAIDTIIPANLLLFSKLTNLFERLHKKRKQRHEQNKLLENFIMEFRIDVAKTTGKKVHLTTVIILLHNYCHIYNVKNGYLPNTYMTISNLHLIIALIEGSSFSKSTLEQSKK